MSNYNIEIDKANEILSVTTDDYEAFKTTLGLVKRDKTSYTTASESEEKLLSQLIEEQNRLCECRTELAKAKGYLSELLKVMPFVSDCDSCEFENSDKECSKRQGELRTECFKHKLQDEIQAFLEGEKKDECGNV